MVKGSFVGNIAQDLALDAKRLKSGKARVFTRDSAEYIELNRDRGALLIKERIDREALCGQTTPCALHCQIILENPMEFYSINVEITDINDNPPTFETSSVHFNISESTHSGTAFILDRAIDLDVGGNGLKTYVLKPTDSFSLKMNNQDDISKNVEMVLHTPLDREKNEHLSLVLTAVDGGEPQMTGTMQIHITVLDANDNAPVFTQPIYKASIKENAPVGTVVATVTATDADHGSNVLIVESSMQCALLTMSRSKTSSSTSKRRMEAPLHSAATLTVKIMIQDQNDNPPQVLYPVQTGGSLVAEMVPRSADVGYLVTKVVAVDVDSGQNAWLSYKLQKATDRALFEVGSQNGEIRTIRQVTDKDAVKQRLTVIVEDNGQPSRSATVIVNMAVADSFPEVLSEFTDFTHDKEYNDNLTFYLVLALAVVSFLFITCLVVIISVKIYRWRQSRILYQSNLPVIPYYPPRYSDTLGTGTLQHVYNYEVCRTTDSRKSD
ncbi:hypothetical protein L3Q82_005744 [Scortum barcoo]|uniref:Uncharacterized protein n=1 Tax=Scortum barcoo TaxID=214431 RepID=A0ACB8V6K8_9TELE|nr:hypothetical protein L3Q82_005744 [Scortum barcoo]